MHILKLVSNRIWYPINDSNKQIIAEWIEMYRTFLSGDQKYYYVR